MQNAAMNSLKLVATIRVQPDSDPAFAVVPPSKPSGQLIVLPQGWWQQPSISPLQLHRIDIWTKYITVNHESDVNGQRLQERHLPSKKEIFGHTCSVNPPNSRVLAAKYNKSERYITPCKVGQRV
jgi:hypothetical protein